MSLQRLTDQILAAPSAVTSNSLIHIVTTADTTQYSGGSSYKTTLGQVLSLVPAGSGPLGGFVLVKDLNNAIIGSTPAIRCLKSSTNKFQVYGTQLSYGTLTSAYNFSTGVFTVPADGYYDITVLMTLSAADENDNIVAGLPNPNGFVGNGAPPSNLIGGVVFPVNLNDYFGKFLLGAITTGGTEIICSNTYHVDYNTSQIVISASYTGRYLTAGAAIEVRYSNMCTNNITGTPGDSIHFTATHIK